MKIPAESFNQFFAPLVGDTAKVEQLRGSLVTRINAEQVYPTDPYESLDAGLSAAIGQVADDHIAHQSFTRTDTRRWELMKVNGLLGGRLAISALRAVGDIYASEAAVPQDIAGVNSNAIGALRYIYGMAFSGKLVGWTNFEAIRRGLNPRNPATIPACILVSRENPAIYPKVAKSAFAVTADQDGQLSIRPRHKRLKGVTNRQCPATHVRVSDGERSRPALMTLIKTTGEVVVSEIFPKQFPIAHE
jgi:hypothetical protein